MHGNGGGSVNSGASNGNGGKPPRDNQRQQQNDTAAARQSNSNSSTQNRELIPGKRRIWGTMKSCSALAVRNALRRIASLPEQINVRRKFKQINGSNIRWWHIISGSEDELKQLENKWDSVQLQMSWKLEPCCKSLDDAQQPPFLERPTQDGD